MLRAKTLGLVLVAVFAFSAVAVASASAAELEWTVHPDAITEAKAGAGELLTVGKRDIKCTGGSTTGEIKEALKSVAKAITYTGCESTKFGGKKCQNTTTKGEIKTNELAGELVYPKGFKGKHEKAAVVFSPKTAGQPFAEFECETLLGAEHLKVTGTAACEVKPINESKTTGEIICSETKGEAAIKEVENEAGTVKKVKTETQGTGVETFGPEESGVLQTTKVTYEKAEDTKA
jgi:hypothetical protein